MVLLGNPLDPLLLVAAVDEASPAVLADVLPLELVLVPLPQAARESAITVAIPAARSFFIFFIFRTPIIQKSYCLFYSKWVGKTLRSLYRHYE
ncbi:hypothetical protein SDC9_204113 [bioreactor metagenome]|uniref:Uncharacterized protein n=1 Tax=bioreactor metagenome TaxID=1076179 RepID=A0A645IYA1_9ZZZZ